MIYPRIVIDEAKLSHNARVICNEAAKHGIKVSGVTKACLADEAVARAMVAGGLTELADSRVENLQKLKNMNLGVPLLLLRIPGLSQVEEAVAFADTSLNSEFGVMAALAIEARLQGREHGVILMVDLGDLREGVLPEEAVGLAKRVEMLKGLKLKGLGVNLTCYGGVIPTADNLNQLVAITREVENEVGRKLDVVSGGNSSSLHLLYNGEMPKGVTNLRIGEAILLGRETVYRKSLPDTYQDCFILEAEVVESHVKPSFPIGILGEDAFGNVPVFEDKGDMLRAIIALGRQDVPIDGINLLNPGLRIIGGSSDHLILDASNKPGIKVGDIVEFNVNYGGLLGSMTSPFIHKHVKKTRPYEQPVSSASLTNSKESPKTKALKLAE